jgi:UDP-N-acetylglucosamine 4,6-dehydratase/5-epimerase
MTEILLRETEAAKVIVFRWDELKQSEMQQNFTDSPMRSFIRDMHDRDRLYHTFDGVDIVLHAAALK